jgi:predicted phage tail protein
VSTNGTTVTYTPQSGFVGTDSFSYTVTDGVATDTATVTVTVDAAPEPPAAPSNVAASSSNGVVTLTWAYSGPDVNGFEIVREKKHKKRDAWNNNTLVGTLGAAARSTTDSPGDGTFRYLVRAVNAVGNAVSAWVEITVSSGGGDGGDGGGGGGPKCHPKRGCA